MPASRSPQTDPDRVLSTGFAELDAILGPGGVPRGMGVALRGDASSGRTTLALRLAAEAQAAGAIVAWLDLAAALDPVEAVARGVELEWLVVVTPADPEEGLAIAGSLLTGRAVDLLVIDLPAGCASRRTGVRRSARPAGRARPPGRDHAGRARAAGVGRQVERPGGRRRRGDRHPAGAGSSIVDPARPGRRRPANGGDRRPQSGRPTGPASHAPDPLRRRRRARRLPPTPTSSATRCGWFSRPSARRGSQPAREPARSTSRPRHPSARESERCDSSISIAHISSSISRGGACPPARGRRGRSSSAGSRGRTGPSSTRTPPRGRSASGAGCRSGRRTGWPRRRPSSTPSRRLIEPTRGRIRAARGVQPGGRRDVRADRRRRSGCSRRRSTGSRACGVPSRSLPSGSGRRSTRCSRACPGRGLPARASRRPWRPSPPSRAR